MYLCETVFAVFCLYFIHIGIGYECIVFSSIVEINVLARAVVSWLLIEQIV